MLRFFMDSVQEDVMPPSIVTEQRRGSTGRKRADSTGKGHNRKSSPKKGGGGGKGTWGKPGDELGVVTSHDPDDPSFEAEIDAQDSIEFSVTDVVLEQDEIGEVINPLLREYLEAGDTAEVARVCKKMNFGQNRYILVDLVLQLGLDHKDADRELCSKLVSDLYGQRIVSTSDIQRAFESVFDKLDDLKLDDPDADDAVGKFLARAVADDLLPPAYVDSHPALEPGNNFSQDARAAVRKAHALLHMHHAMAHLDQVWGVSGARTPVKVVIKQINTILKEFLFSEDSDEVVRCLRDLGVPHFHHELVFEAAVLALEHGHREREPRILAELLHKLDEASVITPNQLETGFLRLYEAFEELEIDIPNAAVYTKRFIGHLSAHEGLVTSQMREGAPKSSLRKRYLSENDGGNLKHHENPVPPPTLAGEDGYASA